jgi:molybdopterin molybdotransferase
MITLDEATALIDRLHLIIETEMIPLNSAHMRILAEDIVATSDLPPFNKAAMDGYACRREELGVPLKINEAIAAGAIPRFPIESGTCSRIMTGAKVPYGADCVIKQEETETLENGSIRYSGIGTGNNICYKGEDVHAGSKMLKRGSILYPQNMGIVASAGKIEVMVQSRIKVGIISTGSELVEPGTIPKETSIINSNAWQLIGQVESTGNTPVYYGIVEDDASKIISKFEEALNECDIVLLTGGASVGDFDFVNDVFEAKGFSVIFQKLAIQPGKPVSFASNEDKLCFGLSGNPVSCFLQFELLVRPILSRCSGCGFDPLVIKSKLSTSFQRKKTDRLYFLPVKTTPEGQVKPLDYHGSAHLTALSDLFGFALIPIGVSKINSEEEVYVRLV